MSIPFPPAGSSINASPSLQNPDGQDAKGTEHDLSVPESRKSFDQKIYLMPESFNALRRELMEEWPELWALVSYRMAYRAEEFVELMNEGLQMNQRFDTHNVNNICKAYLNKLRNNRGLSSIN